MNTILQKRIKEAAKKYCQNKNYILPDDTELSLEALTAIDAYIEAAKSILKNQWISVEEALPESIAQRVLIVNYNFPFDVYFGRYEYGKWIIEGESENLWITHWAEIPSLKGGEK
jgi:hypothetical protein